MINTRFYTWVDVQDTLDAYFSSDNNKNWLDNVTFRAYWDGLNICFSKPKEESAILEKLSTIFLARLKKDDDNINYLELENNIKFFIFFEEVEKEDIEESMFKPSLARKSIIASSKKEDLNRNSLETPTLFAFHSFKGGVGRTLHSIAFALQLAEKSKVLLIDADFEAPGITWLIENREIALSDVLAMVHGSENEQEVIDYTASILKETVGTDGIFVLPAFRELSEKTSSVLEIKPEHIFKFSKNPFILSDIVKKLGIALGVDYIVMDLRAGISELSTGWLLDPLINKVFVTTLSSQSLLGTEMMFRLLSKFEKSNNIENQNKPFLIVSQIPKTSLKEVTLGWTGDTDSDATLKPLRDAYATSFIQPSEYEGKEEDNLTDEQITARVVTPYAIFSEEFDTLKFLPDSWKAVCDRIKSVELHKEMAILTDILPTNGIGNETTEDFAEGREKLMEFSKKMIFAESTEIDDFLITESIRKIATKYRTQVPIAVIVGAKGSGKTFLYKQIARFEDWKNFIEKIIGATPNNSALIFPVTIPSNEGNSEKFNKIPEKIKNITGYKGETVWSEHIKPNIEKSLKSDLTVSEWREKWLDYMAWATGFEVGKNNISKEFIKFLENKNIKMVGIFDGLEDIFNEFNSNPNQQKALGALLQDVPNWLESQSKKYLGITIFIRKDLVSAAITQNLGQFLDKYNDFELKWNIEEALRLVNWIIIKSKTFMDYPITLENLGDKKENDLTSPLYKLWGMKMGKITSNEAHSKNWILGSLANLKKEVQSRDIVRFLAIAAQKSKVDMASSYNSVYTDRVLFPINIRKAIDAVGIEKISEVKNENEPLNKILEILESKTNTIGFPCKLEDIKQSIDEKQIKILEDNGIIVFHNGEYYMAEIYRKGMGFKYSRIGRPKVLYV
ncbi:MAG: hypothetical protein RLZZ292_2902 [Bacteroidota bacterium]|jgi:MinD-like ATPase involved in chromosome partitioning or flagellar assembly